MSWVGIAVGAVTIGTKLIADNNAKKRAEELDQQAAEEKADVKKEAQGALNVAKSIADRGDPTLLAKKRDIKESGANAVGKAVATSGSTQEIINAAQGVQRNTDKANLIAETQASQFRFNAQKLISDRFISAGQLRLSGNAAIDQRTQQALAAIGANAQASTDTAQALGSQAIQLYGTS